MASRAAESSPSSFHAIDASSLLGWLLETLGIFMPPPNFHRDRIRRTPSQCIAGQITFDRCATGICHPACSRCCPSLGERCWRLPLIRTAIDDARHRRDPGPRAAAGRDARVERRQRHGLRGEALEPAADAPKSCGGAAPTSGAAGSPSSRPGRVRVVETSWSGA